MPKKNCFPSVWNPNFLNENFIFFDIDNTIYSPRFGIPESSALAIRLLKENGHHPVLCTGRTLSMIFDCILDLGFDGIIAGGGTYVEYEGKEIYRQELSHEETVRLINIFKENGFSPFPEAVEYMYYDEELEKQDADLTYTVYMKEVPDKLLPIDMDTVKASKVSARFRKDSRPEPVYETLSNDYICVNHNFNLFETIPKNSSKGIGIIKLAEAIGINMDKTYAYGDSFNDLEMLETVKYGVVLENGDINLLSKFPLHAKPMYEDGIYLSLKDFGLI